MSLYGTGLEDLQSLINEQARRVMGRPSVPPDFMTMAGPAVSDTSGPYLSERTDPLYRAGIVPMQDYMSSGPVGLEPDAPVPQVPMVRRSPMWERLGLALGPNPFRVDMNMASGGNQGMKLLLGLLAGYANSKVGGALSDVKRRDDASQSALARQEEMVRRNRQAREDAATERGRLLAAMSQRFRAPKPKTEVLGADLARTLGRPDLAGKSMPKDELDALVGQAKDVKSLREKPTGPADGDPAMTRGEKIRAEAQRETLNRRIQQMEAANARDQASYDGLTAEQKREAELFPSSLGGRITKRIEARNTDLERARADMDAVSATLERFGGGGAGTPAGGPPSPPPPAVPPATEDPTQKTIAAYRGAGLQFADVQRKLNQRMSTGRTMAEELQAQGVDPTAVLKAFAQTPAAASPAKPAKAPSRTPAADRGAARY